MALPCPPSSFSSPEISQENASNVGFPACPKKLFSNGNVGKLPWSASENFGAERNRVRQMLQLLTSVFWVHHAGCRRVLASSVRLVRAPDGSFSIVRFSSDYGGGGRSGVCGIEDVGTLKRQSYGKRAKRAISLSPVGRILQSTAVRSASVGHRDKGRTKHMAYATHEIHG